jgi:putative flippase GtrA
VTAPEPNKRRIHFPGLPVYVVGSGMALLADTAVLLLGMRLGLTLFWAATAGFLLGTVISYRVSAQRVFALPSASVAGLDFLMFAVAGLFGLALTQVVLHAVVAAGWPVLAAKLMAAVISFTCTYLLRRYSLATNRVAAT